ncbi:MAG: hydroxyisourate hydrolase [Flavobacteriales bacterium]|nr:MAG: hydroxyisourate hydrolase [Flavobacteriales bacterium]
MSQITTHVLDTSKGKPAEGISILLEKPTGEGNWEKIAEGITNSDGRISDLLGENETLEPGVYRLIFQTGDYFATNDLNSFYPEVPIIFETCDTEHYHVPLLLNPYGYSTYRGS